MRQAARSKQWGGRGLAGRKLGRARRRENLMTETYRKGINSCVCVGGGARGKVQSGQGRRG